MILPMLNEAVAVLREGVVEDADLLDAGAIFGTGFAPFRGGPLHYATERGIGQVTARLDGARAALRRALSAGSRLERSNCRATVADVTHYVVGPRPAYGRIRSQNHGVVTEGDGELLDG